MTLRPIPRRWTAAPFAFVLALSVGSLAPAQSIDPTLDLPPQPEIEARPPPASAQKLSPGVADGPPLEFVLPDPSGSPLAPTAPTLGVSTSYGGMEDEPRRPGVGPWYVELAYGLRNDGQLVNGIFNTSNTAMTSDQLLGAAVGREVWSIGEGFSLEAGLMVNGRLDEDGIEFAVPVALVFDDFPWADRLPMRVRLTLGPSFTTEVSDAEDDRDGGDGSKFLLLFSPEVEIGWPTAPEFAAFARVHHRTGVGGLIKDIGDGSTYFMAGLRYRFGLGEMDPLDY